MDDEISPKSLRGADEVKLKSEALDRLTDDLRYYNPTDGINSRSSTLSIRSSEAMRRYIAEDASPQVDGASKEFRARKRTLNSTGLYVSNFQPAVIDSIHSILSNGWRRKLDLIDCVPWGGNGRDPQMTNRTANEAAAAANYYLTGTPEARETLDELIKSCLLFPIGIIEVRTYSLEPIQKNVKLSIEAFQIFQADPKIQVISQEMFQVPPSPEYQSGIQVRAVVKQAQSDKIVLENVPIEEMVIPDETVSIDQRHPHGAAYIGRVQELRLGTIIERYPDKKEIIMRQARRLKLIDEETGQVSGGRNQSGTTAGFRSDSSALHTQRHAQDGGGGENEDGSRNDVMILSDEYIIFNVSPGETKLLNVVRVGHNGIIQIREVSNNPFCGASAIRIPNRAIGKSVDDLVRQENEAISWVMRAFFKAQALDLKPGLLVDELAVPASRRAQFMRNRTAGGITFVRGPPREAVMAVPGLGENIAINSLETAQLIAQRKRMEIGLGPATTGANDEAKSVARSASGLNMAHQKGRLSMETYATNIGDGAIAPAARKIIEILIEGADQNIVIQTPQGPKQISPSMWDADGYDIRANLARSLDTADEELQRLERVYGMLMSMADTPYFGELMGVEQVHGIVEAMLATIKPEYPKFFMKPLQEGADERVEAAKQEASTDTAVEVATIKTQADAQKTEATLAAKERQWIAELQADVEQGNREALLKFKLELMKTGVKDTSEKYQTRVEAFIQMQEMATKILIAQITKSAREANNGGATTRSGGDSV